MDFHGTLYLVSFRLEYVSKFPYFPFPGNLDHSFCDAGLTSYPSDLYNVWILL